MNLKKIICWPPLLAGIGAGVTITILGYITYESFLSSTNYGLWLVASFGSTVVVVFGYPNNEFAQPKNIFFGHLISILVGIFFNETIGLTFYSLGLSVGIAIILMVYFKVMHPPAASNPLVALSMDLSFDFILFPVVTGTIVIIIMSILINRIILKRNYPTRWF